ncbi:MAG: hypothetical protein FWD02_00685 [Bacteroidales bacterium]|nr:hypothetical protein [Bacteroidales bacterium]
MAEFEFNTDNTQIGFRLDYLELLNWGTFHSKIWKVMPNSNNSLLTGEIGSGKSTIVDALTCLIVPHHKITFNKAAGAEGKERTMASYIRGEYKNTKNEFSENLERVKKGKAISLRYNAENDTTFSVVLANFSNAGYSSNITLAQVFWLENEKVQKLLIISTKALHIKETFENIEDGKSLKQRIKNLQPEYVGDNFSEYSRTFRRLFGMNSERAIDLFYQTVSMKSVSSLTSFVREQMLEQTDVNTQIEDLKKRFNDLNRAYNAVIEIRKQRDTLFPLAELDKNYNYYKQQLEEIDNILSAIPSYFASKKIALLEEEIKSCEAKLNQLNNQLGQIKIDLDIKIKAKNQIEQDIDNNGGARLKEITKEIEQREIAKTEKNKKYTDYKGLLSICKLPTASTDKAFYSNLKSAQQKIEDLKEISEKKQTELGEKTADLRVAKENYETVEAELKSLRTRKNQIPAYLLDVRQQIIDDLQIAEDKIPFAGELLKVKDAEKQWEGALERLLRGFGVSLLVPEEHYREVSGYINAKSLSDKTKRGIKLDYFPVLRNFKPKIQYTEIDTDSVVNKIEIKEDSYFEEWLQADLELHFNLKCVSIEDFQKTRQNAITIEGQYKKGKKHTKDDRTGLWDRTKFVLGWTNTEKIKAVEQQLLELGTKKQNAEQELSLLNSEIYTNTELNANLISLVTYQNWNELNWQDEVKKIQDLNQEKFDIETSNDILKSLQDRLEKITSEITDLEEEKTKKTENVGSIKGSIKNYTDEIETCKTAQNTILQNEIEVYYPKIDKLIEQTNLTFKNIDTISSKLINKYNGKNGEKDTLNSKLNETSNRIIKVMQSYKNDFPATTQNITVEIDSLPEFIEEYENIVNGGLSEHENSFKKLLNKNTIDDIRVFDVKLDTHSKQIKKKIDEINKHLKEIEFNKGTYIELSPDPNADREISNFKKDLRNCYVDILDTSDAYTENRFNMVKKFLDRFMSNKNEDIEWTKKVTDVRNWFLFSATERYFENSTEKEYFSDSSGKSGGQKEKLAYTILASALAYQFGLSYGEPRSKSFRFAIIDEAFKNGDDESTKFGLELFKKLNLQLLVVTPLQKINIIENYINTVHFISNNEKKNNSEIQYLTAEEYKQGKQQIDLIAVIQETQQ